MTAPALLLVGAGHTHLHLLAHADELTAAGYRVRLLAPTNISMVSVSFRCFAAAMS